MGCTCLGSFMHEMCTWLCERSKLLKADHVISDIIFTSHLEMTYLTFLVTGAVAKRKLVRPHDPSELLEPEPGAAGALPFQMAHTDRMR